MYAVIETGSKQYLVRPGDIIQIEKLEGDKGLAVQFDKVLFSSNGEGAVQVGAPTISGAAVKGEIVAQGRGEKHWIFKYRRRTGYRRNMGHRQSLTEVMILEVNGGAGQVATLPDADRKAKIEKFFTNLKAKGQAFTPKTLGSRKRAKNAAEAGAPKETAPPVAVAKKTPAKKTTKKKG